MVRGRVGESEFSDAAVRDPGIIELRERVTAVADRTVGEDQVRITIALRDGRKSEKFVEHAIGSARNPMTDAQLEAKFRGLAEGVLPRDRVRRLSDLCWKIEEARDAGEIARAAAAGG
jgi:2-methylcitrate dehydratase PrpD